MGGTILAHSGCQNAVLGALTTLGLGWHATRQYLREWLYDGSDRARPLPGAAGCGRLLRVPPALGPGLVLKALAFGNRTENKDAYDLFYVWRGVGVPKVAERLAALLPNPCIDDALSVIETDFCNHDDLGPIGTGQFITRGRDNDIQADVAGLARGLLRAMERL